MSRRRQVLALLVTALALPACGRQGDLRLPDRSPPPPAPPPEGVEEGEAE